MADIDFPKYLRGHLVSGYSRDQAAAFRQNSPFSGAPYTESLTDDTPSTFELSFAFEGGYNRAFWQWFNSPSYCNKGRKEFNIDLQIESGVHTQVARFTASGRPQLTSYAGNVYFYSAQVIVRKVNDPDDANSDLIIKFAEDYNGVIDHGLEQFDISMNQTWPES